MTSCQRWRERRATYRPGEELFDPRAAEVTAIDEATARAFVVRHHYSGSYPAARYRAGLWIGSELSGVAVFSVPMNQRVVPHYLEAEPNDGVELGRLVLLDHVAGNAESWFVARSFKLLRRELGVVGVVSYSDPTPRVDAAGRLVKPGHVGIVYQALNARYAGRSGSRSLTVTPSGHILSERTLAKLSADDRGADYAYAQLLSLGAPRRARNEAGRDYITRALSSIGARKARHEGNHVYTWRFDGRRQPASLPYPKGDLL